VMILLISMGAIAVASKYGWNHMASRGLRCLPLLLITWILLGGKYCEHYIAASVFLAGSYSVFL
jgi:hypothetical protein